MEKTFTDKLREIVEYWATDTENSVINIKELIKTIVPKEINRWDGKLHPNERGFNNCREEILKALEE